MNVPLDHQWTQKLLTLPESGMGYHLVDVTLRDGQRLTALPVYNAEIVAMPPGIDEFDAVSIVDLELHRDA